MGKKERGKKERQLIEKNQCREDEPANTSMNGRTIR